MFFSISINRDQRKFLFSISINRNRREFFFIDFRSINIGKFFKGSHQTSQSRKTVFPHFWWTEGSAVSSVNRTRGVMNFCGPHGSSLGYLTGNITKEHGPILRSVQIWHLERPGSPNESTRAKIFLGIS